MHCKLPTSVPRKLAPLKQKTMLTNQTTRSVSKQKSSQRTIMRQKSKEDFLGYKPGPPKQTTPVAEVFDQRFIDMMKHILGLNREYRAQLDKPVEWSESRYEGLAETSYLPRAKESRDQKSKLQPIPAALPCTLAKPSKKLVKKSLPKSLTQNSLPLPDSSKALPQQQPTETVPKEPNLPADNQPPFSKESPQTAQQDNQEAKDSDPLLPALPIPCEVIDCLVEAGKTTTKPATAKPKSSQKSFMITTKAQPKPKTPIPVCTTFSKGEFKLFRYFFKVGEWVRVGQSVARYVHFARESYTEWETAKKSVVSTIPGLEAICRKRTLGQIVNMLRRVYPDSDWFMPETFLLPEEHDEYLKAHLESKSRVYIAKASGGAQGQGVRILTRPTDLPPPNTVKSYQEAVVQRYITNPLLIDGLKHDLRLYILIAHPDPLIVYLNEEGLARFCTQPYSEPGVGKINPSSHLTNFAINKQSANFNVTEELHEANRGSKRTLSSYWKSLEQAGLDPKQVRSRIVKLVQSLMKAIQPHIRLYSTKHFDGGFGDSRLMHILGVDVLIDEGGNPWILELNSMPSMAIESEAAKDASQVYLIDFYVKSQ